jgi:DNA-binding NarL/FixJ family response regulator
MSTMETTSDRPREGRRPVRLGVVDESELVMLGVDGMVRRHPHRVHFSHVRSHDLDVVLCDPVGRDIDLENYLVGVVADTPARVLAFTWASDPTTARRALAAGAHGWLSKASSSSDLVAAIEAVHRGEAVAGTESLHDELDLRNGATSLSVREREVLTLICRGLSNQEIAAELFVSVNSVKTYIRQIYQKIGVSRRAQAVAWGIARHF